MELVVPLTRLGDSCSGKYKFTLVELCSVVLQLCQLAGLFTPSRDITRGWEGLMLKCKPGNYHVSSTVATKPAIKKVSNLRWQAAINQSSGSSCVDSTTVEGGMDKVGPVLGCWWSDPIVLPQVFLLFQLWLLPYENVRLKVNYQSSNYPPDSNL